MKLASFLTLASLAVSAAFAQNVQIGFPDPNSYVTAGKNITVQVEQPDTIASLQPIVIVISMLLCQSTPCPAPSSELGNVLFTGPFNPQFPPPPTTQHIPQQNYTVQVPSFPSGSKAQLSVTELILIGAGPSPQLEFAKVPLTVQ